jgi:hypothetical protein
VSWLLQELLAAGDWFRLRALHHLHAVLVQQIRREMAMDEDGGGEKRRRGICFRSKQTEAASCSPQANMKAWASGRFFTVARRFSTRMIKTQA